MTNPDTPRAVAEHVSEMPRQCARCGKTIRKGDTYVTSYTHARGRVAHHPVCAERDPVLAPEYAAWKERRREANNANGRHGAPPPIGRDVAGCGGVAGG